MICWEENRLLIKKKKKTFSLPKKECIVFSSSESLTHHDSSDADAHVPDDVEFAVEEVLDACLTVLRDKEHWWFVHYSLDNKEAELIFFFCPESGARDRSYPGVWIGIGAGAGYGSTTVQLKNGKNKHFKESGACCK